jgi:hypothetical protein
MKPEFNIEPVDIQQREAFAIWKNRFVDEYIRGRPHTQGLSVSRKQGHHLLTGITAQHWAETFEHGVGPSWIRLGVRNIGFVSPQQIPIGATQDSAIRVVSDVYVDPKFRGRGLLAACLLAFQEQGIQAILIDQPTLLDNAGYYATLGYVWARRYPVQDLLMVGQDLLIVSQQPLVNQDLWTRLIPEDLLEAA